MSLRDQLLKAGLVTTEQVKQVETVGRKKKHQVKKDKKVAKSEKAVQQAKTDAQRAEQQAKREKDRQLNAERTAIKRRRENAAHIRQMLKERRVNDAAAEIAYNFSAGKVIRRVRVTDTQQRDLARGQLAIVRNPNDEFDFPIVPRQTAEALGKIDARLILVMIDPNTKSADDEWDWPE